MFLDINVISFANVVLVQFQISAFDKVVELGFIDKWKNQTIKFYFNCELIVSLQVNVEKSRLKHFMTINLDLNEGFVGQQFKEFYLN